MRILVVKLTSMGDALHLLPALSDFHAQFPDAVVDWMIEDSFAEIPLWHASVDRVIPVSTRRWRSLNWRNIKEFWTFIKQVRADRYDAVIDAQGLMKSAALARFSRLNTGGRRIGFSAESIKEKPAAKFYSVRIEIERDQHAVDRLRQLFAKGFDYPLANVRPRYSIDLSSGIKVFEPRNTILFFAGTTWPSKHLPDQYWRDLSDLVLADGYRVELSWGNQREQKRAQWIAQGRSEVSVLPRLSLTELAKKLLSSSGAIAVDTGLGHLAAALSVPGVSVYGATDASLTGAVGEGQVHIQCQYPCSPCFLKECDRLTQQITSAPCYQTLDAADIWQQLYQKIV